MWRVEMFDGGWARARSVLVFLPCHIELVCSRARLLSTPQWTAEPCTHQKRKKKTHTQVPSHKDATPSPLQRTQTQSSPMRTTRTSKTTETEESAPNFVSTLHCSSCSLILFYFTFLLENLAVRWMRIFIYFIFI